jgi:hypothetical protein
MSQSELIGNSDTAIGKEENQLASKKNNENKNRAGKLPSTTIHVRMKT